MADHIKTDSGSDDLSEQTFGWLNDSEDRSPRGRMYALRPPPWIWRVSLILLLMLPVVFALVRDDTVRVVVLLVWMMLVIPVCILHAVDFCEQEQKRSEARLLQTLLRVPVGLFGAVSLLLGLAMAVWIGYNLFIHREPEFTGPFGVVDVLARGLGLAGLLLGFGASLVRLAWRRN